MNKTRRTEKGNKAEISIETLKLFSSSKISSKLMITFNRTSLLEEKRMNEVCKAGNRNRLRLALKC